ncbi:MAG: hypothetical protein ACREQ2_04030 [Candidatus Binatia bacterium]
MTGGKIFAKAPALILTFNIVTPKTIAKFEATAMSRFRARHCPKCNGFVGFAVAKQPSRDREVPVTNFCLNCNYRLPVRSIIYGVRKTTPTLRRLGLRLIYNTPRASALGSEGESRRTDMESKISPADYARHLRAIGQELEALHFSHFNLELTADAYVVWVKASDRTETNNSPLRISKSRLQKLWHHRTPPHIIGHEESYALSSSQTGKRLRYSVQELDRIEREQRARRQQQSGSADGHSLSQLLRTLGDLVGRKSERLLGITWQELSVGVVVETHQGRREIDVFRPDNLYDLWVRMYLKRNNRAFIDKPR